MTAFILGTPKPADLAAHIPASHFAIARNLGANSTPLLARLRNFPVNGYEIQMYGGTDRPRAFTLAVAITDAAATTATLNNVGALMKGDVLMLVSGEFVQLTDHPNGTTNVVTIRRGVAGTTAATQLINTTVKLICNARAGDEEFQPTYQQVPGYASQYIQTFQFPYKVAGGTNAVRPSYIETGTPYQFERGLKNVDLRNDIESAALYGKQENVGGAVDSYKMGGLFQLITTNNITSPTNASAFKPSDFNGQVLAPLFGKEADTIFCSPGWFQGLAIWGMAPLSIDGLTTAFGVKINAYQVPFFPSLTFVPVPKMEGISAIIGRAADISWAILEAINDVPHAINGDATSGHWIARMAIYLADERNFVAIRNITAFAKES